jgi:hypothetical protein
VLIYCRRNHWKLPVRFFFFSSFHVLLNSGRNKAGGSLPDTSIFIIRMKAYSVQLVERMYVRALRNQQEEKMRMAGSNRCATIKSGEAVFHHYKQAGVLQQCAESIADIKDLELASTQKAVEIPETLIGADFLKRRVLKIDQCTEKFLEFHSQTSAVGVVEPVSYAIAYVKEQYLGFVLVKYILYDARY